MTSFRGYWITKPDHGYTVDCRSLNENDLMPGEVLIKVEWSTVNYKDGLALTGQSPVVRQFPMIPGVDLAGVVEHSTSPAFKTGDAVIATGGGLGETHFGAYAGKARVNAHHLVPLPSGLTLRHAMAIGTAGFTAMLCVMALEKHGIRPSDGPAVVTGAAGGVGSVAVALLAKQGFCVTAVTGRPHESDYLRQLGAHDILDRAELNKPVKPLAKERWACGIDSVGSVTLANVLSMTQYNGAIAACGLAQGLDLPTTVAPFILRNVALLGVESVQVKPPLRINAWSRLTQDLDLVALDRMVQEVGFDDLPRLARDILAGQIKGRLVVNMRDAHHS